MIYDELCICSSEYVVLKWVQVNVNSVILNTETL